MTPIWIIVINLQTRRRIQSLLIIYNETITKFKQLTLWYKYVWQNYLRAKFIRNSDIAKHVIIVAGKKRVCFTTEHDSERRTENFGGDCNCS